LCARPVASLQARQARFGGGEVEEPARPAEGWQGRSTSADKMSSAGSAGSAQLACVVFDLCVHVFAAGCREEGCHEYAARSSAVVWLPAQQCSIYCCAHALECQTRDACIAEVVCKLSRFLVRRRMWI